MSFDFDGFAAKAKELEHVTNCMVQQNGGWVEIITEAYLAKEDGTVERCRGIAQVMADRIIEPGKWLLSTFDSAIKDRYEGFTRYATADEIAAHKAGGTA